MTAVAASPPRINLESASVLVVEASAQGADVLAQVLIGFGVRSPLRASSAEEAMRICNGEPLDLIICEPVLPGASGYEFVRRLRRSRVDANAGAPVLLISPHTPKSRVIEARDCGANFLVVKPLSPRVMLDRILWIARENRAFIQSETYSGPDRRFQSLGPPAGMKGRRADDFMSRAAEA